MKIGNYKTIKIQDLKAYDRNSRTHPTEQIEQIKKSILEFGFTNPLLVNERNEIIAGHGRLEAVKQLNKVDFKDNPILEVPCIELTGLNEAQYKALVIADNKIAENAGWNFEILKEEIQSLELMNFDIDLLGFKEEELLEIGLENKEDIEEVEYEREAVYKEREEAKVIKQGDLIELGRHRILCGDSTKKEDVDKLMGQFKADMVLSDPTYGMKLDTDFGNMGSYTNSGEYDNIKGDTEDFTPEIITTFFNNFGYCKEMFLFGADYFSDLIPNKDKGSFMVWDKRHGIEDLEFSLSEFEIIFSKTRHHKKILRHKWLGLMGLENKEEDIHKRIHANQKPVRLLIDILDRWGKDKNIVVDLYLGSGSTLIACEKMGKSCFGIEYKNNYIEMIIERYINFTGDNAIKINGELVEWNMKQ